MDLPTTTLILTINICGSVAAVSFVVVALSLYGVARFPVLILARKPTSFGELMELLTAIVLHPDIDPLRVTLLFETDTVEVVAIDHAERRKLMRLADAETRFIVWKRRPDE